MAGEGKFIDNLAVGNTFLGGTRQILINAQSGKAGATAGWTTATNTGSAKCAASSTAATFVVGIDGLMIGDVITGFTAYGQIEGDGAVTLDVDLRKLTAAAADLTDASVGAITQVSTAIDAIVNASKTGLSETVGAGESFYFLCTATTAAGTDVDLQGFVISVQST